MNFKEKILTKSNSYNFYKNGYEDFLDKNSKLKDKNSKLKDKNSKLKDKNSKLKDKNSKLKDKNSKLKEANKTLNLKIIDLKEDLENHKGYLENRKNQLRELKSEYNLVSYHKNRLFKKYEEDYFFNDFESILSKFYISPYIRYPFSYEDKRCFAFMDYFAKSLRKKSNENILVSIIFPVYNYEEHILESIESILNQTFSNFELFIVDDNSDDKTKELLKSITDPRVNLIFNDFKEGTSFCRNLASEKSSGDFIFYLDMGNLWNDQYLEIMLSAFLSLNDADALYSGHYLYHDEKTLFSKEFDESSRPSGIMFGVYNKSLLYNRNYISLSAFAHKRSLFDKVRFDESLDKLEDWDFILHASRNSRMYSVPILQSKLFYNEEEVLDENLINLIHDKNENYEDFSLKYSLNKKISIIIPSYELLEDLEECINTILSFDSRYIEIIVVDNNSNERVRDYLKTVSDEGKIKYIQNDINYGFTYAIDQGISVSDKDSDILLLNNDAILTKGALEAMQYYAYDIEDAGILVPQEVLYPNDGRINFHVPYADSRFECDVTPSKAHRNIINIDLCHDGEILELSFAPFFCTYIKRDVYNKTLGLDPELGRHYRSDRIYSNFIRHVLGLKIYQTSKAKVYHKSQESTKKLKENEKEYDLMFSKNQWEPELARKLGYKNPLWDL